jgi:hypothetical protein
MSVCHVISHYEKSKKVDLDIEQIAEESHCLLPRVVL